MSSPETTEIMLGGVQLSLIANFVLLWAGPNSSLPLVGLGLILVGTIAVGYGLFD